MYMYMCMCVCVQIELHIRRESFFSLFVCFCERRRLFKQPKRLFVFFPTASTRVYMYLAAA